MGGCHSKSNSNAGGTTHGDGGISTRSFNRQSNAQKLNILRTTQKEITKAKSAETRLYKKYLSAEGAVRMTYANDNTNRVIRQKAAVAAKNKYEDAFYNRRKLESRLQRYADAYRGQATLF